jgi:hypothetical protein
VWDQPSLVERESDQRDLVVDHGSSR